jgi:uncharacterized protein
MTIAAYRGLVNPRRPHALTLETFDAGIILQTRDATPDCPKCHAKLEAVKIASLTVERCTGCHGIWFDVLEWDDARKLEGAARIDNGDSSVGAAHDLDSGLRCPKCLTTPLTRLAVAHHPGLHVDKCARCYSMFFDAGEFREFKELSSTERLKKFWHLG